MKQSHWLLSVAKEFWLVPENHATVKLDSSVAPRGMETYSESKIELRNLKKREEDARKIETVFVIRAALWAEYLGLLALDIAGFEKVSSENLQLQSTLEVVQFEVKWKKR